jgi:hypothetical protein
MSTTTTIDMSGFYEGMLEGIIQWKQLLKDIEDKQLTDNEKKHLIQEYFQLEEDETIFFQKQETHQHRRKNKKQPVEAVKKQKKLNTERQSQAL